MPSSSLPIRSRSRSASTGERNFTTSCVRCGTDPAATSGYAIELGFDEVGFAAVLVSATPSLAFSPEDFPPFLERMVACGEKALSELVAGRVYPFGNLETALVQIHRGTHRPYPCGAGAAYLSANAEGKL